MDQTRFETLKRIKIANELVEENSDILEGAILTGSVAYAPNLHVKRQSDIDLVFILPEIKSVIDRLKIKSIEKESLRNRYFEGYCIKQQNTDIPISIHYLSMDCFDIICKSFVSDIRVYRNKPKEGHYMLKGFESQEYQYYVKNVPLENLEGVRTIVPISFIKDDRYFIGIHRDKILSNSQILFDPNQTIKNGVKKLWEVVTENMVDESRRLYGKVEIEKINITNALVKKDKFSFEVMKLVQDLEVRCLEKFR